MEENMNQKWTIVAEGAHGRTEVMTVFCTWEEAAHLSEQMERFCNLGNSYTFF